jgi:hypothetical protein
MKKIPFLIPQIILVFCASLLFDHCIAVTDITSYKDPAYYGRSFTRILVIANTSDLQNRLLIESTIVNDLMSKGVFALPSSNLFPPTRDIDDNQKIELLLKNNIDAYISISVGETGVNEVYIPQTEAKTKTEGTVNVYGNTGYYREKSKTTYEGGYTIAKPWATIDTKLYDVSNSQLAWMASSFTGGNAFANKSTLINSYSSKTVEQLLDDGILAKSVK